MAKRTVHLRRQDVFRKLDAPTSRGKGGVDWASCHKNEGINLAFRRNIPPFEGFGIMLTNADLALLGLGGLAFGLPISLAVVPTSFVVTSTSILTAGGVSGAGIGSFLASTGIVAVVNAFIKPKTADFASFNKPCTDPNTSNF